MLHMSKYPSSRSGRPEKVREEFSSRTRTEGNRMADEKKSKMWRRSFLQKTGVGAAAVGAMTAAPTILKMTENVQASPPPGDMNAPVMAYVKDAATGTVVVMWGTQEIVTRDPGLVIRLTNYARRGPMSSHREAPTISKDPVADNTDLYAFVDPVDTSKVTILSNFIPLEEPAGGPNFFQLADDVLHEILIATNGDGLEPVTYQLRSQTRHLVPTPSVPGVNGTKGSRVHTSASQVPNTDRTRSGFNPSDPADPRSGIGVWSAASRRKGTSREKNARIVQSGPWVQVSRLGEPLINEVVIELGEKDLWNSQTPDGDSQFVDDYAHPQLQGLLPVLYPGVFPKLAALSGTGASRADLIAILLTGIPSGIIPGFQNSNGPTQADELRLNLAFAPSYPATDSGINPPGDSAKRFGLLGGDLDGFPDGRRVFDNVTAVELRAIAGATYPLIDSSFTPDAAARLLMDRT